MITAVVMDSGLRRNAAKLAQAAWTCLRYGAPE